MEGPVRRQLQDMGSQREAKSYNLRDFNESLYSVQTGDTVAKQNTG
jgi:hypothetical protein